MEAPNPLEQYPAIRQWAYRAFWVAGLVLGSIQVYCMTVEQPTPTWFKGAIGVLGYLSIATNYTADRNVTKPADGRHQA